MSKIKYSKDYCWDGSHCFGFSLEAGKQTLEKFDYTVFSLFEGNNAVFLDNAFFKQLNLPNKSLREIYFEGYIPYLLGNALMTSFGSSSVGSAFGYQISQAIGNTYSGGLIVEELFLYSIKSNRLLLWSLSWGKIIILSMNFFISLLIFNHQFSPP